MCHVSERLSELEVMSDVAESPILDAIAYEILSLCFSFSLHLLLSDGCVGGFLLMWRDGGRGLELLGWSQSSWTVGDPPGRTPVPLSLAAEAIRQRPGGRRAALDRSLRPSVGLCARW